MRPPRLIHALMQSFRICSNLNETATSRINSDLNLATKPKRWLTWNVMLRKSI